MTSGYSSQSVHRSWWRMIRPRTATLVMLSVFTFITVITWSWFSGESSISQFFAQLHLWQENPPIWLEPPDAALQYLLLPALILATVALVVVQVSPAPQPWSQALIVAILLALQIRYLTWRMFSSLNLADPLNGTLSLILLLLEVPIFLGGGIQLFLTIQSRQRKKEADLMSVAVSMGEFLPTVDILIPTYNEGVEILRRTIIGCQAIEYNRKQIYLLDDGKRLEMRHLAQELGCQYITRSENRFAKAGNLNHAIAQTHGELIVVFDADFVPSSNFLTRTVGLFQRDQLALVQTHQDFYNADPFAYNLGLEHQFYHPLEEIFSRYTQLVRDGANATLCYGSSFVVRRSHLVEVNGFYTKSLSEDYFTAIQLLAKHYEVIFLDEQLSAGLAPESVSASIIQRQRWGRGTIQSFFVDANPLTISGLNLRQRLAYLEGILLWLTSSLSRVGFLIIALAYPFLGLKPILGSLEEWLYFFLPLYLVNLIVFHWLNRRSCSTIVIEIYSTILCFPVAITTIHSMLRPFSKKFQVTPKGITSDRFEFNWTLAIPLILLWLATSIGVCKGLGIDLLPESWFPETSYFGQYSTNESGLFLFWSGFNLFVLTLAIMAMIDAPKPKFEWFKLERKVKLKLGETTFYGVTRSVSEAGAKVCLNHQPVWAASDLPVQLEFVEEGLELAAVGGDYQQDGEQWVVAIAFNTLKTDQYRRLVKMLFCRPGQWKPLQSPGEFQSLLLLFKALLRPRILFDRHLKKTPTQLPQGIQLVTLNPLD
ncbi:MAG: glycosyltransferase [Microcoleaceae cyanobacterium]